MSGLLSGPALVAGGFTILAGACLAFAPWPWARRVAVGVIAAGLAPWAVAVGAALSDGW